MSSSEKHCHDNQVAGMDISADQSATNQKNHLGVRYLAHDFSTPLAFGEKLFQAIWCSELREHLFDPAFALGKLYRVLNAGGIVRLGRLCLNAGVRDISMATWGMNARLRDLFIPTNLLLRATKTP